MANTFKSVKVTGNHLAATDLPVGSGPGSATTTHVIIGMTVSNITASAITVEVLIINATGTTRTWLIKDAQIEAGVSLIPCGGEQKVVLTHDGTNADKIIVRSNTANSTNIVLSYLENT